MGGLFAPYEPGQQFLLPPSLRDWLPEDHLCHFISDTVDQLDIGSIVEKYRSAGSGNVAYHPRLMLKLLIYGYSTGVFSSRKIARHIEENVAFRVLAAGHSPSHRSLCRFRQQHIAEFQELFVQVVQIAAASGLVKMGTLAIDGTKIKANSSKHKAMSYGRMKEEEERLVGEIDALVKAAGDVDKLEDAEFGANFRGDELPEELRRREDRLQVIQDAKKRLEERKREEDAEKIEAEKEANKSGKKRKGRQRKHPLGEPKDSDQENFTDPDSRIMKDGSGAFEQCYNAQAAVDSDEQIVVAAGITQCAADNGELLPMLDGAIENSEMDPGQLLADSGYKSEDNFKELESREIDAYIPLGREGRNQGIGPDKPASQRMQHKLKTKRGRRRYAKRKHIAESPFGWIKRCLGFRAFSMRGLANVTGEWALVCLALNLSRMNQRIAW